MKVTIIDPPEGWRYGFPRPLPDDVKNIDEWLVSCGYPRELTEKSWFYYRCWERDID